MDVFANTILPETVSHFYLLHLDYKFKIQNREDSADIIDISFPEWQTETVECTNLRQQEYGTYGRYSIQSVLVDFYFQCQ